MSFQAGGKDFLMWFTLEGGGWVFGSAIRMTKMHGGMQTIGTAPMPVADA